MNKDKPVGFMLFTNQREAIEILSDEAAGKLLKALYQYCDEGIMPKIPPSIKAVFLLIKSKVDDSRNAYMNRVETNRKNANKRWQKENEAKAKSPPSRKSTPRTDAIASHSMPSHAMAYNNKYNKKDNVDIYNIESKPEGKDKTETDERHEDYRSTSPGQHSDKERQHEQLVKEIFDEYSQ